MLVLTRKPGEQIIIAGDIRITVVSVGPGRVKIGIDAPPHVTIDRQEIHTKKQSDEATPPVTLEAVPDTAAIVAAEATTPAPLTLHNRLKAIREAAGTPTFRRKPR